jgi:cellobiose phosphorylase
VVRHVLGIRFEGARLVISPALYPQSPPVSADLRFRQGRLRLSIEGSGKIKRADLDGKKLEHRPDGSILLPEDFTSGTVRIRADD